MGGEGGRKMSSRKEEGGRLISQLLESLTTSVTFFFQQMFQHKIAAESHDSWKVQLPLFHQLGTIAVCCVDAPNPQLFWIDGLKKPWDAPWEALRGKRICLLFSTTPTAPSWV